MLPGCGVVPAWHCWHRNGERCLSSGATVEPCGVWQFMQSSFADAWFHRNGPRFSAWQLKQVSLTLAFFSSFGPMEPCGLWQSEHATLPASIGCAEMRCVSARCILWQLAHTSVCVTLVITASSFAWTLWQSLHVTPFCLCWPPSQCVR